MFNLTPPRREQARLSSGRAVRHHAGVATSTTNPRRAIPSVERLLRAAAGAALAARYRREHVVETTRMVLDDLRRAATDGARVPADAEILARVRLRLEGGSTPRLMRVINATGVVRHTNLGRAPLAEEAIAALTAAARGAVNRELDLESGRRGDRDALLAEDLRALTGAEASLVVNNNAAAVLLLL